MLLELHIKNLGLIKENSISFKEFLNVITGESGAGKSLIIRSIHTLFNDRVNKDIIGIFGDDLYVKGVFEPTQKVIQFLSHNGIFVKDDDHLILEKTVSKLKKKTVTRLNHEIVSQDIFKKISTYLISFSLQNETTLFQDPSYILNILDANHFEILEDYQSFYQQYNLVLNEINELKKEKKNNEEKLSYYEFQLQELENFSIQESDFELESLIKRVKNQKHITGLVSDINEALHTSYDNLEKSHRYMMDLENLDDSFKQSEEFANFFYEIEGFQTYMKKYKNSLSTDDNQNITDLQSRAFQLKDIQRKYGSTIEEVIAYQNSLSDKIHNINNFDDIIEKKDKELKEIYNKSLLPKAKILTSKRQEYAKYLSGTVTKHLQDMNMENTNIIFSITSVEQISKNGMDNIEVMMQHLSQEPRPLLKSASGGELSRIILALKIVISEQDDFDTMIFDEIDTGTGGKTANSIGQKLHLLSQNKQVICITHTPQVASYSDNHIYVTKSIGDVNNYVSNAEVLSEEEEIIREVARMISGNAINDVSLENAKMLRNTAKSC